VIDLRQGDCLEVLKTLPDESVNCAVTSPPYFGLRDYGVDGQIGLESSVDEYVQKMVQVFREVRRVLRDDGTVWLNLGDSYAASRSYQVSDNKHLSCGPSRHLGRATPPSGLKQKDLIGIPWKVAFALQADGWYLRQDIIWHKPNPMPESVTDRCTKAHEYIFLLTKSARYYYDAEAVKEPNSEGSGKWGKMVPTKTAQAQGKHGASSALTANMTKQECIDKYYTNGRNRRSVWTVNTQNYKGAHFATFPPKLIEPCILAGCPKEVCSECGAPHIRIIEKTGNFQRRWSKNNADGSPYNSQDSNQNIYTTTGWEPTCTCNAETTPGTVLDPFNGSGTTGSVALQFNRKYIGIELNPEYLELTKRRLWSVQPELF
jgi:DNA modification methylase